MRHPSPNADLQNYYLSDLQGKTLDPKIRHAAVLNGLRIWDSGLRLIPEPKPSSAARSSPVAAERPASTAARSRPSSRCPRTGRAEESLNLGLWILQATK